LRKFVAFMIATLRNKKSSGYYAQIGGGSPLRRLTEEQARSLQDELRRRGHDAETFVGMITWRPFFDETLARIEKSEVERLIILPLFPHFSVTTTGSGFSLLRRLMEKYPRVKNLKSEWIKTWKDHPAYIEAFARAIEKQLKDFPDPQKAHLLFSAHSIPESY